MKKMLYVSALGIMAVSAAIAASSREVAPGTAATFGTLALPKGTYTAIVFSATGEANATAAIGVIKVGADQFPVNIGAGTTVAIPFGTGWVLDKDAEIQLRGGNGSITAIPIAWAVTPSGPIELKAK